MATSFNRDQTLLQEAYSVTLLESTLPTLTIAQLSNRIQLMSESELEHTDEVVLELFGGLRNIGSAIGKGAQRAGAAVSDKARQVGSSMANKAQQVGSNVAGAAQAAVDKTKAVGAGVAAGAKQVGQNVKNIYDTGEVSNDANKRKQEVATNITKLEAALEALKEIYPDIGDVKTMSLSQIQDLVDYDAKYARGRATIATNRGVFNGAGDAYKKASGAPTP